MSLMVSVSKLELSAERMKSNLLKGKLSRANRELKKMRAEVKSLKEILACEGISAEELRTLYQLNRR